MRILALALALSCAMLSLPVIAREVNPAERREVPYDASIPGCDHIQVLNDIADRFKIAENRFWNSSLQILAFEQVRQTAWRPWGLDTIPRRFCSGTIVTSDGQRRQIDYSVREDLGFIGASWGTEWCVHGLDRHYAYAPHCRQARP